MFYVLLYVTLSSLQCYSVLSDILVKIELCIPLERGSNVLSTGQGFICLCTGPRSAVGNVSGYRCVSDCNPGVASSIPTRTHTFVEIAHEIISTVILLPSADSFKKGCCQLQAKVCA